jgi:hypothetical protein
MMAAEVRTLKELHKLATMMATCMRRMAVDHQPNRGAYN